MKAIDMIKDLCEYNSDTYKKTLVFEFLQDINFHPEAKQVFDKITRYGFLNKLDMLSKKNTYDKKQFDYLDKEYALGLFQSTLDKLLTAEGNFRVATNPHNKYETVGYDMFRDFQKAQKEYAVVSRLTHFGLEDGEAEELIKFALTE